MASLTNAEDLITCPVCFEHYRDPRVLRCAHQFCLKCLQTIADDNQEIKCPTCRVPTPVTSAAATAELPRPVLMNEVQDMLKKLLNLDKDKREEIIACNACQTPNKVSIKYCIECSEAMCNICFKDHEDDEDMEGHKTVCYTDSLFCKGHGKLVVKYCSTCSIGICKRCDRNDHSRHTTDNISIIANQRRKQAKELLDKVESYNWDNMIASIESTEIEGKKKYKSSISQLETFLATIKKFETFIQSEKEKIIEKESSFMAAIQSQLRDAKENRSHAKDYSQKGQFILKEASDLEVIVSANHIPIGWSADTVSDNPPSFQLPDLDHEFIQIERSCNDFLQGKVAVRFTEYHHGSGITDRIAGPPELKERITFDTNEATPSGHSHSVTGLTFMQPRRGEALLAVRNQCSACAVQIFDMQGKFIRSFSVDVPDNNCNSDLAYDTKRGFFLMPYEQCLLVVSESGAIVFRIETGKSTYGAAIVQNGDVYLTTHVGSNDLLVIDPESYEIKKRSRVIVDSSELDIRHSLEYMCTFTNSGRTVVIASDKGDHRLFRLDLNGQVLQTYSHGHGSGSGYLCRPAGVAATSNGRVFVIDSGNKRLMSFWAAERGDVVFDCTLPRFSSSQIAPSLICIDDRQKIFAIADSSDIVLYDYS